MTSVVDAVWKKVKYLRQGETPNYDYEIFLPEPLANWDTFDYWERERVRSMATNLTKEDILYDIGAESGWMSAVFGKICQVFLIEPTREWWPNIYAVWNKNLTTAPVGCFSGLVGVETNTSRDSFKSWPQEIGGDLLDHNKYEYLHEHTHGIDSISVDELVKRSGVTPTSLSIDVEGGELAVLTGAAKTLKNNNLKVWVSIHPNLLEEQYKKTPFAVHSFMESWGYVPIYLVTDHEEHWYYHKK